MKFYVSISFFLIFFYSFGISQSSDNFLNSEVKKAGNSIFGKIFMGENLLTEGKIYLLQNTKSLTTTLGNTSISDGSFKFEDLAPGAYTLYIIPVQNYDFFYFPKYLPTYSGNVSSWNNASIISKKEGVLYTIYLNKYSEPFYGNCKISGEIKYDASYRGSKLIPISVLLLNKDKVPMDFRIADKQDGTFSFEYLPSGKYYIHPEIPGFHTKDYEVIVKSKTNYSKVDFNIKENTIEYEKNANEQLKPIVKENGLELFFDASTSSPIICELTDISGKSIFKNIYLTSNIFINTSEFATGIYLLKASTYSNSIVKTAKIFINNN